MVLYKCTYVYTYMYILVYYYIIHRATAQSHSSVLHCMVGLTCEFLNSVYRENSTCRDCTRLSCTGMSKRAVLKMRNGVSVTDTCDVNQGCICEVNPECTIQNYPYSPHTMSTYSVKLQSRSAPGRSMVARNSSNFCGHSCMRLSTSGILLQHHPENG